MKEKYQRLLASVLTAGIIFSVSGCTTEKEVTSTPQKEYVNTTSEKEYVVKPGDTLYNISIIFYGSSEYYNRIAEFNGIDDPNLIKPGDVIKLPIIEKVNYYTIKEGDTLYDLCMSKYGRADEEIIKALALYNNIDDYNVIIAGQKILLPEIDQLNNYMGTVYNAPILK